MISVKDLHKSFGGVTVLDGISTDIEKGDVVCIIGPSGSGKSTFLRCLNRLDFRVAPLCRILPKSTWICRNINELYVAFVPILL